MSDDSRHWASAAQLAGLPDLPGTARGVKLYAERHNLQSRARSVGKGVEYYTPDLPATAQEAWAGQQVALPAAKEATLPALKRNTLPAVGALRDWQRAAMDARAVILREVEAQAERSSLREATAGFVEMVRSGWLPDEIKALVPVALGRSCEGESLSVRTLQRWQVAAQKGLTALAPVARGRQGAPSWYGPFLAHWRNRNQPTVVDVLRQLADSGYTPLPSYSAVLRYLRQIGQVERNRGRLPRLQLVAMLPFIRRDFSMLQPMDVLNGDGYTAPVLITHPNTGKPFQPELTEFFDVATRLHVGWSINFSENKFSVMDALRMAVGFGGVPAVVHYDNGSGAKNEALQDEVTGLKNRLGFDFYHQRPGNPRSGGVVEKGHSQVFLPACKAFSTYVAKREGDADLLKEVTKKIKEGRIQLPILADLAAMIEQKRAEYNNRPHRSLPKVNDPITRQRRHQSPLEAWQGHVAAGWKPVVVADTLDEFRLEEIRSVRNAEIEFHKMYYAHPALVEYHQQKVRVRFDPRDGTRVWVWSLKDDRLICEAKRDANRLPYLHDNVLEHGRQQRLTGQLKRIDRERERILAEGRPTLELVAADLTPEQAQLAEAEMDRLGLTEDPEQEPQPATRTIDGATRPIFSGAMALADWGRWAMAHREQLSQEELEELEERLEEADFRVMLGLADFDGQDKKRAG